MLERVGIGLGAGVAVGLMVAAMLVPFVVLQTRPGGPGLRWVGRIASTAGYAAAVGAVTMLPLPTSRTGGCDAGGSPMQWLPLDDLGRLDQSASVLLPPALGDLLLNLLLFVPLGAMLRRWWSLPPWRVAGWALLISLGIETTQLTGVWFVYDCAFRVFDVDDILANALGALAGAALLPRAP